MASDYGYLAASVTLWDWTKHLLISEKYCNKWNSVSGLGGGNNRMNKPASPFKCGLVIIISGFD